jgi:serine/threonine-protein kinase
MFISEYSEGVSLAEWRQQQRSVPAWKSALGFVANVADVLDWAHRHGFVHGNLKPTNVFLPGEIEITSANLPLAAVQVGEFGIARAVLQSRLDAHSNLPWPMPQYLAPEQLVRRPQAAEISSDVYAIGVLLYELLTSQSSAMGATREEVIAQTRTVLPTPPKEICSALPDEVSALTMRCLRKQPTQRLASAKLVADACRALIAGTGTTSWWRRWLNLSGVSGATHQK